MLTSERLMCESSNYSWLFKWSEYVANAAGKKKKKNQLKCFLN